MNFIFYTILYCHKNVIQLVNCSLVYYTLNSPGINTTQVQATKTTSIKPLQLIYLKEATGFEHAIS